jgi:alpha-tubulin suppressor-like RCC1 family protein
MTITSRALVAVLAVGAFSGCSGDDTTSTPADDGSTTDGTTSADSTGSPTTGDPVTSGGTTAGPTSSTGEGSSSAGETGEGTTGSDDTAGSDTEDDTSTGGDASSSSTGTAGESTDSGVVPFCGDGTLDDGEECDDGDNNANDAACTAACTTNVCGDGFTHLGVESCDDGDADDLDACHNDCSAHVVEELALGSDFTCARFDSGNVKCWGHGASGRLGYGNLDSIGDDETPDSVGFLDLGGSATALVAGASHACAVLDNGAMRCWGAAGQGNLGYGNMIPVGDNEAPGTVEPIPFGETVTAAGSGDGSAHSCAALDSGTVKCWGPFADARLGIVGQAENVGDNEPMSGVDATDVGLSVTALVAGQQHTCARTNMGNVRCWGTNAYGGLGYGNLNVAIGDDETPASAGDVPLDDFITDIASGWQHTCVVLEDGGVQCWGRGNDGRLGYSSTAFIGYGNTPADVGTVQLTSTARQVAGGLAHTCALLEDNTVQCWGANSFGQLGYGNTDSVGDDEHPAAAGVIPLGIGATAIAAGGYHTCAITDTGSVRCWGRGDDGRLGYGATDHLGDDEAVGTLTDVPLLPSE